MVQPPPRGHRVPSLGIPLGMNRPAGDMDLLEPDNVDHLPLNVPHAAVRHGHGLGLMLAISSVGQSYTGRPVVHGKSVYNGFVERAIQGRMG